MTGTRPESKTRMRNGFSHHQENAPEKKFLKPLKILITAVLLVSAGELAVMFFLSMLPPLSLVNEALLDATLVTVIVLPILNFTVIKPLRQQIAHQKHLEAELRELSLTDDLTGLYNRRGFFTFLEQELKLASRLKKRTWMLYADVDDLKLINDTWGHKVGDMALEETAKILEETYRESDVIARLGGDEFAVLIIDPHDEDIEALRSRLENKLDIVNSSGDRAFRLSLSVGLVYLDPDVSPSIDELLVAADSSMYEHKRKKTRHRPNMSDRF